MCGIVGYIGDKSAGGVILQGLKRLEYRGYDSCGIACINRGLVVKKDVGEIDEIEARLGLSRLEGSPGIGHTRWATHGGVTKENAHPHLDCSGEIAVVHNGIISNHEELRAKLEARGHSFASGTDTEVIPHLIEEYYDSSLEEAVRRALAEVEGTYAVLVISAREPDKIIAARRESPLVVGVGDGEMFVASDIFSFLRHTRRALPLDDGEYAVVTRDGVVVKDLASGEVRQKKEMVVEWSDEEARKEGYPHFMLKEIHEQPRTVASALKIYREDVRKLAEMIASAERVYLAGAGTSLHAAMVAEYWFSKLAGKVVIAIDSSELRNKGVLDEGTLVVGITQSGETYDTLAALRYAKQQGASTAAIVNVIGSTATRIVEHVLMQGSGIEIAVCATKTYTSQLTLLLRTAIELARLQEKEVEPLEEELRSLPAKLEKVLALEQEIRRVAEEQFDVSNYLFIGKGINYPTALEAALKLKEISYLHAEGMSSGLLKHGTISLIDENMHTVAFVPARGENRKRIVSNIQEVKAREGRIIAVASGSPVASDACLLVPECSEEFSPIVFAPVFQLLAYYVALKLGRNVDKPRALAKSVTVE
ncbi:MAG: glutamine--fructose-6-phosphate transaminase (isomerizing) [Euryarchaeota archaeon]|nr:glutamine--fructose-6-phosphate transaminase (isomerizing) [Euryarchaeota archaeon]